MQAPAAAPAPRVTVLSYLLEQQQLLLAMLALYVFFAFFLGVLARKTSTKTPSWLAWIPIANLYLMSRIARQSILMAVLMLVPLVNLFAAGKLWTGIAIARGKPAWTGWLILVPGLNLLLPMYLAAGAVTDPEAEALAAQAGDRPAFCPECGAALEADQQFCGECGFDVTTLPAEPDADPQTAAASPAAATAAGPPKMVMRSPAAIAGILAALAVVAGAAYVIYDSFQPSSRPRQMPPLPPAMAGTLTAFPIDSTDMHPLQADAVAMQQLDSTPLRVPAGWLPKGLQPSTLVRHGTALTSATYRAHAGEAPVAITVVNAKGDPAAAMQEITREVAQASGATPSPIQVKTPTGDIYQGTRIRNDREATYVLAHQEPPAVVIVHAAEPSVMQAAERLTANVGNGDGLAAFPAVQETLSALPNTLPVDMMLQEVRTISSAEIGNAEAQLADAAKSLDGQAEQLVAQARMILPQNMIVAKYVDAAKQEWDVVRGQYGSTPKGLLAWTLIRGLLTMVADQALPTANGEGRLFKMSDRQVVLFRAGASLIMLAAPPGATPESVRKLAEGMQ